MLFVCVSFSFTFVDYCLMTGICCTALLVRDGRLSFGVCCRMFGVRWCVLFVVYTLLFCVVCCSLVNGSCWLVVVGSRVVVVSLSLIVC